jgi:type IV fimbrial biogenesis protein FimT
VTISVHQPVGTDPCGGTDTATSVAFNGYGRVATTPTWATGPLQCVQVQNPTATGTRRLQIVIGAGGTVRMCDPAVTDANDPRRC